MAAIQDSALLDRITGLGERVTAGTDLEILEIQLRGSGKARLLRVFIDKRGGVTHGDCELISERLGNLLDEEDVIPGDSYTLEVSSPGAERKLSKPRDFERVLGQKVRVFLREPIKGVTSCEGRLSRLEDDTLELEIVPGEMIRIPLSQVQKANLTFEW